MGFRFRKSLNLGGGFRLNFSKSGIGFSIGGKGFRYTHTATGRHRSTFSIPGSGISYVVESGAKKRSSRSRARADSATQATPAEPRINAKAYQPQEALGLICAMQRAFRLNGFSNGLILTFVFAFLSHTFLWTGLLGILLKLFVHLKFPVQLPYTLSEEEQHEYEAWRTSWLRLKTSNKLWLVVAPTEAEGGTSLARYPLEVLDKAPFFLKTDVPVFGLKSGNDSLYFLPDRLLILSRDEWGAVGIVPYRDLTLVCDIKPFVEGESVPNDAQVVAQQWLWATKDGSPDRRYKHNRQIPVCEYGEMTIEAGEAPLMRVVCSLADTVNDIETAADTVMERARLTATSEVKALEAPQSH